MRISTNYIYSPYGARVFKICASCRHSALDNSGIRVCRKGEGHSKSNWSCAQWEVKERMLNAGKGGGRILKKGFIQFQIKRLTEFNDEKTIVTDGGKRKIKYSQKEYLQRMQSIRNEYEEIYGDIREDF